ncbi:MAG TPA: molybdenum cofactor guanylyltransferase [Bacillales bacterium]|nr:molybdenum cofactor guanylyltransferase [Bacillales bacterium]
MVTGVILAGGENRRMGGNMKSFLRFGGETIVERQLRIMKDVCDEVIIVTNRQERFSDFGVQVVSDNFPGKGPLAGIEAAFTSAAHEILWIAGCDMPYVSRDAAQILLDSCEKGHHDAAIPVIDGVIHPLFGVYHRRKAAVLKDLLQRDTLKVRAFLDEIDTHYVDGKVFCLHEVDPRFVTNVNTPDEYAVLSGEGERS